MTALVALENKSPMDIVKVFGDNKRAVDGVSLNFYKDETTSKFN